MRVPITTCGFHFNETLMQLLKQKCYPYKIYQTEQNVTLFIHTSFSVIIHWEESGHPQYHHSVALCEVDYHMDHLKIRYKNKQTNTHLAKMVHFFTQHWHHQPKLININFLIHILLLFFFKYWVKPKNSWNINRGSKMVSLFRIVIQAYGWQNISRWSGHPWFVHVY